jgi:hypothetical protein
MSNNLNIDQVASNQDQKEITINAQAGSLDAAITEQTSFAVTSTNALTLTDAQFRENVYFIFDEDGVDPADADFTITCPAVKRGLFIIRNDTEFTASFEITGQSGAAPTVPKNSLALLSCDGSNVEQPASSGGSAPFDVGTSFGGAPSSSEIIMQFIFTRSVTFPSGLATSQSKAGTASTGTATFTITQNASAVGEMVFDTSDTATFTMATDTTFAVGDILEITAPSSADSTLADLVFTLAGVRN